MFKRIALICLVVVFSFVLFGAGSGLSDEKSMGLIGEWHFDELKGDIAYDSSGNKNDGEIIGASWTKEGKHGGALRFDGRGDVVMIKNSKSFESIKNELTIECWVKLEEEPDKNWRSVVTVGKKNTIIFHAETKKPYFAIYNTKGVQANNHIVETPVLELEKWYHLVAIYDENEVALYINGIKYSRQYKTKYGAGFGQIDIGNIGGGENIVYIGFVAESSLIGVIDEVKIFNKIVPPKQSNDDVVLENKNASEKSLFPSRLKTDTVKLITKLDKKYSSLNIRDNLSDYIGNVRIEIRDDSEGESKEVSLGKAFNIKVEKDRIAFEQMGGAKIRLFHNIEIFSTHITWGIDIHNDNSTQKRLEVKLDNAITFKQEWNYQDAHSLLKEPKQDFKRTSYLSLIPTGCMFPMSSVFSTNSGLAIGVPPLEYLSYLEKGIHPNGNKAADFYLKRRIVIDSEKKENMEFVLYSFPSEYGWLAALDRYYRIYPDVFRANPDVDPRLSGNGAQYRMWFKGEPEICRRFYGNWEWCYAPFRRTGDWYGGKKYWEYKPAGKATNSRRKMIEETFTYGEFHEWRRKSFHEGKIWDVAMLFYLPSAIWCEEQLAKEVYPEAMTIDKISVTFIPAPWVTTHDNTVRVYPWGNKFAEDTQKDILKIIEELNVNGFAFDVCEGTAKHRGIGAINSPGRAYDENGTYVLEAVGIGKLMDYIHSLKVGKYNMGIVGNPMGSSYLTIFRCDSAMYEDPPYLERSGASPQLHRYFLGKKTINWHTGYRLYKLNLDYKTMSATDINDLYRTLRDDVLLSSFKFGGIPSCGFTLGVPRLIKYLPAIAEVTKAGWQPIPAVIVDSKLWASRFGEETGTFITIGNPTFNQIETDCVIQNTYIGKWAYLFSAYDGNPVKCILDRGETKCSLSIPPKTPFIIRSWLGINLKDGVKALITRNDSLNEGVFNTKLELKEKMQADFVFEKPHDCKITLVKLNGKNLAFKQEKKQIFFSAMLDFKNDLDIYYDNLIFGSPEDDFLEYPFVINSKPNCTIVVGNNAEEGYNYIARRLQEYFRFYYEEVTGSKANIIIPIMRANEIKERESLIVIGQEARNELSGILKKTAALTEDQEATVKVTKENNIFVMGKSLEYTEEAMAKLLFLLDKKYIYIGTLSGRDNHRDVEFLKKAGLLNGVLE